MDNQHHSSLKQAAVPLLHPLFLSALSIFFVHQTIEHTIYIRWIDSYLDDILFPMVLFPILSFLFQMLKIPSFRPLPTFLVFLITLMFTVYFEYILPQTSTRYTADPADVLCYAAGTFLFQIVQNKKYEY